MSTQLLTLNVGSSSIKYALFEASADLPLISRGQLAHIGSKPQLSVDDQTAKNLPPMDIGAALDYLLEQHILPQASKLMAVGHRVVCGGAAYTQPTLLEADVIRKLEALSPIVPLHQPHNLAAVNIIKARHPNLRQLACFDTAFHHTLSPLHYRYALPDTDAQLRRYGYHGLSYEWIAQQINEKYPELTHKKIIAAHIGSGVSLCAMQNGTSVQTSMGMSALEGPIMGTRCGSVDPGALIYMQRQQGLSADDLEHMLYHHSGLKALCGESNMRAINALNTEDAAFALEYFACSIAGHAAMLSVSLGGLDGLIFSGGIGENDASLRSRITQKLAHLGDVETVVIAADEERVIAQHLYRFLENG